MKIIYVARHNSGGNDDEGAIAWALEQLGHEIVLINEGNGKQALEHDGDLLLFHKWSDFDTMKQVKYPKIFWYFDKVRFNGPKREQWMLEALKHVDLGFLSDGTYARQNGSERLVVHRQGVDTRFTQKGRKQEQYTAKIAFLGSLYGERGKFMAYVHGRWGSDFKTYFGLHQRNLANCAESVPIFIAPPYPSDSHYWSNRVYVITGHGGFLLHPYCEDLAVEYIDKQEIVFYRDIEELHKLIDYYLRSPFKREEIRLAGKKKTNTKYSYKKRCEQLLNTVQKRIGKIG